VTIFPQGVDTNQFIISPASRQLNASNWNTGRNFSVTAVDDTVFEQTITYQVPHTATSSQPGSPFNGIGLCDVLHIAITINDNDPMSTITPTPLATDTPTSTVTPTATPTATPIPSFSIRYSNELGQPSSNWSVNETGYIQTAVQHVGEAFQIQLNASSAQEAFNRVMTNGADPQYVYFFKADGTSGSVTIVYPPELSKQNFAVNVAVGGCLTVNNNGLPRTIVCNWAAPAQYPIHAIVHELGHVFTNRSIISSTNTDESTRGLLYAAIGGTYSGVCTSAFAPTNNPDPFAGMVFNISRCERINDGQGDVVMGRLQQTGSWVRGERGWGSGPDNVFTPFQQHPFDVFPNDQPDTQVDETAADMFLNWVYRRRTNNPPTYQTTVPNNWEGFSNEQWVNNGAGSNDYDYPGDARFEWMNRVMNQIFALKGW